jgi:deoxycytidine triphosphate deaminase
MPRVTQRCETPGVQPTAVLSDRSIRRLVTEGRLRIEPWDPAMVQPASIDLKLGSSFRVFHNHRIQTIDLAAPPRDLTELVSISDDESFVVHPGEFVLGQTAEWVELPEDIVARIEGKALALDTKVPTPEGWKTMAELGVGDEVFDPSGDPVPVVAATEPMLGRPCREVVFSDETTVVADLSHTWEVQNKYDRRRRNRYRLLTTEQIEGSFRVPWDPREFAYHVPLSAPVKYPEKELPIDPYVLGVWLGDGTSASAEVTCADREILEEVELAGYAVRPASNRMAYRVGGTGQTRDPVTGRYCRNDSLSSRLRDLGLLGHKRIPRMYLEAGIEQRFALLEGLMDTDGYVDTRSRCDLTTIHRELALDYRELIASLGFRPIIAEKTATLYGRVCGLRHEVTFTPHQRVFRLPRKVKRQDLISKRHRSRGIREVRETESVPVRCIQVGTARGAFLITDSFITTHNSSLGRLGLICHATAGFVDPGWRGTLTLELTNFNSVPIVLRPGLPIAQLSLMALDAPAERPYGHPELGSHYTDQVEATESRYEGKQVSRRNPSPDEDRG